jgi:hypothetical protein
MKMQYKYNGAVVDVFFNEYAGQHVNPHDIIIKIAELARLVDVYAKGHITITMDDGR